ncbi:MAG: SHOCT domain-containing protein [Candidatus Saccharimonadales bacterium]|jgi:putative membrane protein
MFIVWVVIIGILIFLVVYFIANHHSISISQPKNHPLEIAKTRYAKGEINKEQFEEIKKELQP